MAGRGELRNLPHPEVDDPVIDAGHPLERFAAPVGNQELHRRHAEADEVGDRGDVIDREDGRRHVQVDEGIALVDPHELLGAPQQTIGGEEQVDDRGDAARGGRGRLAANVLIEAVGRIVEVHVGVDQPRDQVPAAAVDDLLRRRKLVGSLGESTDPAVTNRHAAGEGPVVRDHGDVLDDGVGVHGDLSRGAASPSRPRA